MASLVHPAAEVLLAGHPSKPLRFGTPPCGQVDIVPIEAPRKHCAAMAALRSRLEHDDGGALRQPGRFRARRAGRSSCRCRTFRRGRAPISRSGSSAAADVRELCGVRIVGESEEIEEVLFTSTRLIRVARCRWDRFISSRRSSRRSAGRRAGARVSRDSAKPNLPVFLEHRVARERSISSTRGTTPATGWMRSLPTSSARCGFQQGDIAVRGE